MLSTTLSTVTHQHYWQTLQRRRTNEYPCIRQMDQADTLYSISPHLIFWVGLGQTGIVSASRFPALASLYCCKLLCMCLQASVCKGGLREGLAKPAIDPHWPLKTTDQMRWTMGGQVGVGDMSHLKVCQVSRICPPSLPPAHTCGQSVGLLFRLLAVYARVYTHRDTRFVSLGRPSDWRVQFSSPP